MEVGGLQSLNAADRKQTSHDLLLPRDTPRPTEIIEVDESGEMFHMRFLLND